MTEKISFCERIRKCITSINIRSSCCNKDIHKEEIHKETIIIKCEECKKHKSFNEEMMEEDKRLKSLSEVEVVG
jgi:hypothetical protein